MNGEPNVLIVGAGPTGLVMAHELARVGIACRVVDKSPHRAMESRGHSGRVQSRLETQSCHKRGCRSAAPRQL